MMTFTTLAALAHACAPQVSMNTLTAVVQVESLRDPLVIGVNGPHRFSLHATTLEGAAEQAESLIRDGRSIDLGLMQINSRNLGALGLSVRSALDPCINLRAGAQLLTQAYLRETSAPTPLDNALSRYNTGDPERGRRNGYVARVRRAAYQIVPDLASTTPLPAPEAPASHAVVLQGSRGEASTPPAAAGVDVFARPAKALVTWSADVPAKPARTPSTPNPGDPS